MLFPILFLDFDSFICVKSESTFVAEFSQKNEKEPIVAWSDAMLYDNNFENIMDHQHATHPQHYALFTSEIQAIIRAHQNPLGGCTSSKYLVSRGNHVGTSGLGSILHLGAMHLGIAMMTGREFLWQSDLLPNWADEETCGAGRVGLAECFLRSPSSCDHTDTSGADIMYVQGADAMQKMGIHYLSIPESVHAVLSRTGAEPLYLRYLWNAQATAYLAVFNKQTISDVRKLRLGLPPANLIMHALGSSRRMNVIPAAKFPLERGTLSLHLRQGADKTSGARKEMNLVDTTTYFRAAQILTDNMALFVRHRIFASSENPLAFADLQGLIEHTDAEWIVYYSSIPRSSTDGDSQLRSFTGPGKNLTASRLVHMWLLQLVLSLECDAWVGTRASNWNRLIDELRCIWVPKCNSPFIGVGAASFG